MKLKVIYSIKNMVVRLVNLDAIPSKRSSNRMLKAWTLQNGTNLRVTYWNNDMISSLYPYQSNRVNVYYDNHKNQRVTQSYYCIDQIIKMDE